MPKQVVVMMSDHYPFGECQENVSQNARILVRKIYDVREQQKIKILQKANILRRLKFEQLIKLESVLQEDESVHFLFEYVPIRLETWISNINDQFIQNFRDQLIKFSHYLANNCIIIEFKLKNIGMDHEYGAKYFLDPGFVYQPNINRQRLKSQYIRDIYNLFKPYIEHDNREKEFEAQLDKDQTTNMVQRGLSKKSKEKSQVLAKTFTKSATPLNFSQSNQNRRKESQLKGYPTDMNVSVDEQVLTDILGVLDDENEEDYRPKSYTQTGHDHYVTEKKYKTSQKLTLNYGNMKNSDGFEDFERKNPNNVSVNLSKRLVRKSQIQLSNQQQVRSTQDDNLQNRIRKAIENSRSIIRRFESIKCQRRA